MKDKLQKIQELLESVEQLLKPELVTRKEAAAYLGVSVRTVDNLLSRGELAFIKVSAKSVRIRRQAIEDYIKNQESTHAGRQAK